SRVAAGYTVGVLVLANFGAARQLTVAGVPVGRLLEQDGGREAAAGSCIVVVATDTPVAASSLERVARRVGLGRARTGSVAQNGIACLYGGRSSPRSAAAATSNSSSLAPSRTRSDHSRSRSRNSARCRSTSSATPKWISASRFGPRRSISSRLALQESGSNSGGGVGGRTKLLGWIRTPAASPAKSVSSPSR